MAAKGEPTVNWFKVKWKFYLMIHRLKRKLNYRPMPVIGNDAEIE